MYESLKMDALFRRYYRQLCLYAMHYVMDADTAEDIVSGCFASLWQSMTEGGNVRKPLPYLYKSVRNASVDHLRSIQAESLSPRDMDGLISDDEAVSRSAPEARLWAAVDRMPSRRRMIFLMAKRDAMSYAEIASELGISVSTVRNQIESAIKTLRGERKEIIGFILIF